MRITSPNNQTVRLAASLSARKQREANRLYLVEGPNLIREALVQGIELLALLFSDEHLEGGRAEELLSIYRAAEGAEPRPNLLRLERAAFRRVAQTETSQGVVAVARIHDSAEEALFAEPGANVLVLDRIQDPGNVGTLLRTAEAAGFSGAILMKGSGDAFGPKAVRAAAGSLFRLPLLFLDTAGEATDLLRRHGKRVFAADGSGECDYDDCDLAHDAAVVIGNEGNGLSEEWLRLADVHMAIPMEGKTESLNAALAGGIILYEAYRQKRAGVPSIRRRQDTT